MTKEKENPAGKYIQVYLAGFKNTARTEMQKTYLSLQYVESKERTSVDKSGTSVCFLGEEGVAENIEERKNIEGTKETMI